MGGAVGGAVGGTAAAGGTWERLRYGLRSDIGVTFLVRHWTEHWDRALEPGTSIVARRHRNRG
ncbi:hypothetical protein GCM10010102_36370 [Promicromonospora citrea]|uniref:Uncharacterized protein n=1 Tax=Promicromonospora citrea TaxID=43677 RepID=A0A8H9GLP7_9MICO|nr:hypothetical protein GCM10010102_36370 [Promicromonospora citrea]